MHDQRPDAVVFDLDGTLVDSAEDLRRACNRLLAESHRRSLTGEEIRRFIGDGAARLVERAFLATGGWPEALDPRQLLQRFLTLYGADPVSSTRCFPGVPDTLRRLHRAGVRLGVCTNKPVDPAHAVLAGLGLHDLFDVVIGGDSLATRKPSPEPLLAVLAGLGVAPARAVMVGDNEHDAATARAAGLDRVYLMAYGYARLPLAEIDHDGVLDRFEELTGVLGL